MVKRFLLTLLSTVGGTELPALPRASWGFTPKNAQTQKMFWLMLKLNVTENRPAHTVLAML